MLKQVVRRPFHESIVFAIRRADGGDLENLAELIKYTRIPTGHDRIIDAWDQRIKEMVFFDDLGVSASLRQQKRDILEEGKEKQGVSLFELQQEAEKLLALLNDRQPGLMTWHEFMKERLESLHRLTSKALGK